MSQRRIKTKRVPGLGPTGQYPYGKLNPDDEGEIRIAIAHDPHNRTVVIDFGKPVAWIGLPPQHAREFA